MKNVSTVLCQTGYAMQSFPLHFSPLITCLLSSPLFLILKRLFAAKLTFAPRVEEHEDVLVAVVNGCCLALCGASRHREPIQATHGTGWRVDGQLDFVAILFHDLGLPAFILQGIHPWNDDMSAFGHHGQRTYDTQVILGGSHVAPEYFNKEELKGNTVLLLS